MESLRSNKSYTRPELCSILPQLDLSILPRRIADLADVIGIQAALKIVDLRGGTRLTIPQVPKEDHWLVPHIGWEAFVKLCNYFGGDFIDVDKCHASIRHLSYQAMAADLKAGSTVREVALKYDLTERWVWIFKRNLLKKQDLDKNDPIYLDMQKGLSIQEMADKYGCSERWMRTLRSRRSVEDGGTSDLFDQFG